MKPCLAFVASLLILNLTGCLSHTDYETNEAMAARIEALQENAPPPEVYVEETLPDRLRPVESYTDPDYRRREEQTQPPAEETLAPGIRRRTKPVTPTP